MAATEGAAQAGPSAGPVKSRAQADGYDKTCIFCKIGSQQTDTELVHFDGDLACFKDIKPGAPQHYLVVPVKHVGNCRSLTKDHVPLVEKMVEVGKSVLQKNNITDLSDVRLGFHWPPFSSVNHLHLHVLAPASEMGFMSKIFYRIDSYWFVTAEQLIQRLNSLSESN
ncbi:adenosine 5'-monophosphoramidase HINT3 [Amia ocellicauda]|uniref:adenosine 5'-monophosphoramidase HINT3 n=1 Tax=Amia ocellicauda TaxID=2972642 RepID=UPI0034642AD6